MIVFFNIFALSNVTLFARSKSRILKMVCCFYKYME